MPRVAGQQDQRAARAARLPASYDDLFDTLMVRMAYRCRAYPDQVQQQMLNRTFGCVRVVWNQTLAARHARWQADRIGTSYAQADAALTLLKKDPDVGKALSDAELEELFDLGYHLKHVDAIFDRVFGNG